MGVEYSINDKISIIINNLRCANIKKYKMMFLRIESRIIFRGKNELLRNNINTIR